MKLYDLLKGWGLRRFPRFEQYEYDLTINKEPVQNINVKSTLSHRETYKKLRSFKTPQYNDFYLFRNKKGFNTVLVPQKYDVIVCNHNNVVIDTITEVPTGYISDYYERGFYIYFTPVGTINFYNIQLRDFFELRRRWLKK